MTFLIELECTSRYAIFFIYITAIREVVFIESLLETMNTLAFTVRCRQSQDAMAVGGLW